MVISTVDNNQGCCKIDGDAPREALDFIHNIASSSLNGLAKNNRLITIPDRLSGELRDDTSIISIDRDNSIHTGNIVGFVGDGRNRLSISSRFDCEGDFRFVHYLLCRCMGLNITDFSFNSSTDNLLDLLPLLFPSYLRKALNQGVYRQYRGIESNDLRLKGRIDVTGQIKRNMPFSGRVCAIARDRLEDNPVMQLIRHTIEYLRRSPLYKGLMASSREIADDVATVTAVTAGTFSSRDLGKVLSANSRIGRHPYFTAYAPLQRLCLMILNRRKTSYGDNGRKIHGILIDIAWLWEEYLAKVLAPLGVCHPRNRSRQGAVYISNRRFIPTDRSVNFQERYPDIYTADGVIDAKYKRDVTRDDYHQIITYLHIMGKRYGALISPGDTAANIQESYMINGGGTLHLYKIGVAPDCRSYADFRTHINQREAELLTMLSCL